MTTTTRRLSWLLLPILGCGGDDSDGDGGESEAEAEAEAEGETVSLSGNAFIFSNSGGRLEGATVTVLEREDLSAVTDADGGFRLEGLQTNSEATLVMDAEGYALIQTGTIPIGTEDVERVTFQSVDDGTYAAFEAILGIEADETKCQIATTVTRVGKSLYDEVAHGEAGATVTIDPDGTSEVGPVYFNAAVIPDADLDQTSEDGGVVWANVQAGPYTLTAHKDGVAFTEVEINCRAGVLVNASPPWGLQAL